MLQVSEIILNQHNDIVICFQTTKLNQHMENGYCEKRELQHPCPECGKMYKWRKRMLKHVRDFHPEKAEPIKPHRLADVRGKYFVKNKFNSFKVVSPQNSNTS